MDTSVTRKAEEAGVESPSCLNLVAVTFVPLEGELANFLGGFAATFNRRSRDSIRGLYGSIFIATMTCFAA